MKDSHLNNSEIIPSNEKFSIQLLGMTCQEYGKKLVRQNMLGGGIGADGQGGGGGLESLLLLDSSGDGNIKQCPMCHVPIERDAGCAQMMCKRCKHVFCWFCLKSLDVSFGLWSFMLGD